MSKNILIRSDNGAQQIISNVTKIETELEDNSFCNWLPEDEVLMISNTIYSNDKTLAVYIDKTNQRRIWYFMGYTKEASDVNIPFEIIAGQPGLIYSKAYSSDKTTQIGWIGFYNNKIRSWPLDKATTLAGTFWGVVYSDGTQEQTNEYSNPPND